MAAAVAFYHRLLLEDPGAGVARKYLRSRGFDGDVARAFSIGWAPDRYDTLSVHLQQQKFARQEQTSIHGALASSVVFAVRKLVKGGASTQRAGVVLKRCSEPTSSRRYCMAYALRNRE